MESVPGRDPHSRIQWDASLECSVPAQTESMRISGPLQAKEPQFGRWGEGATPTDALGVLVEMLPHPWKSREGDVPKMPLPE